MFKCKFSRFSRFRKSSQSDLLTVSGNADNTAVSFPALSRFADVPVPSGVNQSAKCSKFIMPLAILLCAACSSPAPIHINKRIPQQGELQVQESLLHPPVVSTSPAAAPMAETNPPATRPTNKTTLQPPAASQANRKHKPSRRN